MFVAQTSFVSLGIFLGMFTHDTVTVENAKCIASKGYIRITADVLSLPVDLMVGMSQDDQYKKCGSITLDRVLSLYKP